MIDLFEAKWNWKSQIFQGKIFGAIKIANQSI